MSSKTDDKSNIKKSPSGQIHRKKSSKCKRLIWGAAIGYVAGCALTLVWFFTLTTQLHCSLKMSTVVCSLLAFILTLGLAFNKNMRCVSCLILPMLFSAKGRSTIIAFAFVLAMTGPCKNILVNIDALSTSISCGQQQLKMSVEKMLDVMKRPLESVKEAIQMAMGEMKKVLKKIESVLKNMRRLIIEILESIKNAFNWLGSVVSVCNKEFGTPFDRCVKIADNAMADCKLKLGVLKGLCKVTNVFKALCYSVKFIDVLCVLVDFISDSIIETVTEKLKEFNKSIQEMFYVSVTFDHDFSFSTTSTKDMSQVGKDILAEIHKRTKNILYLFGWTEIVGSFLFVIIIIKALYYKAKYLKQDRFDNHFITKNFRDVDEKRKQMDKDVVLPLSRKERNHYVNITSMTLVRSEILKMARSVLFLLISCIQLFCICLVDYSLYWLLATIRYHGMRESGIDPPPFMSVNVTGAGFIADIYSGIIRSFEPMVENYDVDPTLCLPDPEPANLRRYLQIGGTVFLAWLFLILEPYGLRMRQVVMDTFYPERARERSIWLYNHILLRRENFITLARRQARRKFLNDDYQDKHSFLDWLRAKTNSWWIMRKLLGSGKLKHCMLCGSPFNSEENMVACPNMSCKGKYCQQCFEELNNTCFLCKEPIEYGDLSDISEEKDSSDELEEIQVSRCKDISGVAEI